MNQPSVHTDVRTHLCDAMSVVAPDVVDEIATIDAGLDFFEEFGLDSMDRLTIMERLVASTGVAIPDDVAVRLNTIEQLAAHLTAGGSG
ncbi:MAG: acyl carrier protein [Actinomycetota bacterium]